jgi:integral membrane protein
MKISSPAGLFRIVATAEAITWALLISSLIARAVDASLATLVSIAGAMHGFTFLSYGAMALVVGINQRWPIFRQAFGVFLAIVPFATIPFEAWLRTKQQLEGSWRKEQTDDPRDKWLIDKVFRWAINHPVLMFVAVLLVIIVVYNVLLILGPPTSWFR